MSWTLYEKQQYLDSDLPYIAMKLGYIRIMTYVNQIGIQCLCDIVQISNMQKNAVIEFISNVFPNTHKIECITVENFLQNDNVIMFKSFNEFLLFLN